MKPVLVIFGVLLGLAATNAAEIGGGCSTFKDSCHSIFSGFPHVQNDLHKFTRQMLEKSYDFLLLSSSFDVYSSDRPGFEKLYRKISDKAWEDTIELIKYQSRRGASVTLADKKDVGSVRDLTKLLQSNETSSLELALEYEKILALEAHHIHKKISHAVKSENHDAETALKRYDPDVAHFLDEKIIEYQSGTIRKLAGYITNLRNMVNEPDTKELAIHLFDEYLEKVE